MDKYELLKLKIDEAKTKSLVASDMKVFIKIVLETAQKSKDEMQELSAEQLDTIKQAIAYLETEHTKLKNDLQTTLKGETSKLQSDTKDVLRKALKALSDIEKIEVRDGVDADEDVIVDKVLAQLPKVKETILDGRKEIVEKINTGKKNDLKIEAKQVEGFDKLLTQKNLDTAIEILDTRTQYLINKTVKVDGTTITGNGTDANPLVAVGGGGGGGVGDVVGPTSATDYALALFDGTTGKLIKNSVVTVNTLGQVAEIRRISAPQDVNLTIQTLSVSGMAGKDVLINASGVSSGTFAGGNIVLNPGAGNGGAAHGRVKIAKAGGVYYGILDAVNLSTADRTFTFPDASGTFALLNSPVFTTNITTPLIIGGTAVGSNIIYKSTTGAGTAAGIAHQFVGGTDGATVAMTVLNNGNVGIGTTGPNTTLDVNGNLNVGGTFTNPENFNKVIRLQGASHAMFNITNGTHEGRFWADATVSSPNVRIGTKSNHDFGIMANNALAVTIKTDGNVGIGQTTPTAVLHLKAGTATASTAPLKFTSGTLNTTAEAGAVEFLTDAWYGTITTGSARRTFAFLEAPVFTTSIQTPTIELGHATDTTLSRTAAGEIATEGIRVILAKPKVLTATSYTTDTGTSLNMDNLDQFIVTAQAGALLFNAPGGTKYDGQNLIIAVTGTASRALTWNPVFEASTVPLPSSTSGTARLNIGFKYRSDTSKWVCLAVS